VGARGREGERSGRKSDKVQKGRAAATGRVEERKGHMALEIAGAGKRENTRLSQKKKRELVWRVRQRMANASASRTGTVQMDRISPEVASLYGA